MKILFPNGQQVNDTCGDYLAGRFVEVIAFAAAVNITQRIIIASFQQEITDAGTQFKPRTTTQSPIEFFLDGHVVLLIGAGVRIRLVRVCFRLFAEGITYFGTQVKIELESVAAEIDMSEERYFEIIDRTTVFIGRMLFEFLVPSLLAEIQFGLQPQVLFCVPAQHQSGIVSLFHFRIYLGIETYGREVHTEGSTYGDLLRKPALLCHGAYNNGQAQKGCDYTLSDHLTSLRVTLKSLW